MPDGGDVSVAIEDPARPDVVAALREADAWYATLYPAGSNHLVDVETLRAADVAFYAARRGDGALLGFGAVVARDGYAEIKRMYVDPAARGLKLGRRLLERLERHALDGGFRVVRLETGTSQPKAISLYRSAGYRDIAPFGDYSADPLSLFMEKRLA